MIRGVMYVRSRSNPSFMYLRPTHVRAGFCSTNRNADGN
jgi:hypothetical protein